MRTSTSRSAAALAVAGLAGSLVLTAGPATASDPGESTLTGSKKPGSTTSTWTGSVAYPGADLAAVVGATDSHTLTVRAPGKGKKAAKYFTKYAAVLDVTIAWSGVHNDLDLRVLDADGNELALDGQFATESESVSVPLPGAGTYVVEVTSYLAEPGVGYDATATLTVGK